MKKGLRQRGELIIDFEDSLNPCPDEEGIKTHQESDSAPARPLNPCPDEEGIKTGLAQQGFSLQPFESLP